MYHIPARNEKTGEIEFNTLLKKGEYFPVINEIGPQQDFVKYKKPELQDAYIDKQIKIDLEKLLETKILLLKMRDKLAQLLSSKCQ